MAGKVRGLTVEISADTKKFNTAMSELRTQSTTTQKELNALKQGLALEYDDTKFQRAQQLAQQALDESSKKIELLRAHYRQLVAEGNADTDYGKKIHTQLVQAETAAQKAAAQIEKINRIKLDDVTASVGKLEKGLTAAGNATKGLSAAAAGTLAGLGAIGVKSASTGAELDDLSLRLGISAEKIQEMQYVAVQTGVDFDVFQKALIKARAAILDLSSGKTNEQAKAIQALGLSMEQFGSDEEMFDGILKALSELDDKTQQAALANEIFGDKIAYQMLPYLNTSTAEVRKLKDEFAEMSLLSNEQVKNLAGLDDTIYKLKETIRYAALQVGASLVPAFQRFAGFISESVVPKIQTVVDWFGRLTEAQQTTAFKILGAVALLSPALLFLGKMAGGLKSILSLLPTLKTMLTGLATHPVIAVIGVIAGLLVMLYTTNEQFRQSINNLIGTLSTTLSPLLGSISTILQTLMSAIAPLLDILGGVVAETLDRVITLLQPVFDLLSGIFELIGPLIELALKPLQAAFQFLSVPLQFLGTLLKWLGPLFNTFGKLVSGIFKGIVFVINGVLGWIEDCVNWVIGVINFIIDGINALTGWLGVHIDRIENVSLKIEMPDDSGLEDQTLNMSDAPACPGTENNSGYVYDETGMPTVGGDNYEIDNSTKNIEQNVTVVIENYAKEVDTDKLIDEINRKLAEGA